MRARPARVAVFLIACACSTTGQTIGGAWFVENVPAQPHHRTPARRDLLRWVNGTTVLVASFVGHVQYYEPDCVAFEQSRTAAVSASAFREIDFVCGNRTPASVAVVTPRGVRFDSDGIRPLPGVAMNASPGPDQGLVPRDFVSLSDLVVLANHQELSARAANAIMPRMNSVVTWTLFGAIAVLALVFEIYRRRRGLGPH